MSALAELANFLLCFSGHKRYMVSDVHVFEIPVRNCALKMQRWSSVYWPYKNVHFKKKSVIFNTRWSPPTAPGTFLEPQEMKVLKDIVS